MPSNSTLASLAQELVMFGPRLFQQAEEQMGNFLSMLRHPGTMIANVTSKSPALNATITSDLLAPITPAPASFSMPGRFSTVIKWVGFDNVNNFDGVFSYFASRWAVSTFLIAIILNRARVYSSSRRRLTLNWYTRLALRIVPIVLFFGQLLTILQTLRCQTGDLLPKSVVSSPGKTWNGAFTHEGGPLHDISSALLFWQTEQESCSAARMLPMNDQLPVGSSSVLWPMFLSLCLSHLLETISCALQGRHPVPETAMTIFEHSLAFAEAETIVRGSVGLGLFGPIKSHSTSANAELHKFTRSMILHRLNVPPEVLLIALISTCSHLTNHILGVLGIQSRCRLVNTSIWGLSFMTAFFWSFVRFARAMHGPEISILRYPTVCIVGFIPHIVIFASILVCSTVYALALFVTILCPPTAGIVHVSWGARFRMAHDNLVASTALSPLQIRWSDEFYTTLLKVGFITLTAASEAVFFNEGVAVAMSRSTWLEEQRFKELSAVYPWRDSDHQQVSVPTEVTTNSDIAEGLNLVDTRMDRRQKNPSGYARERTTAKASTHVGAAATLEDGVGGTQRASRWVMSYMLLHEQITLLARLMAKVMLKVLRKINADAITDDMVAFANPVEANEKKRKSTPAPKSPSNLDFWVLSDDGTTHLPTDTHVDVESELRQRLMSRSAPDVGPRQDVDEYLYGWWKQGGFWGEVDSSGDYQPSLAQDDDATSIITDTATETSSTHSDGWESSLSSGQRTPTQTNHHNPSLEPLTSYPRPSRQKYPRIRSPEPQPDDILASLAHLLDPQTLEEKQQARLLASRLQQSGPLTRSQYRRNHSVNSLRLLGPRERIDAPLTRQEEEDLLERLLFSRRRDANATQRSTIGGAGGQSWEEGGEGLGAGGPQCVVCQSSPRTILVWPCRCLCLCEECRVSLAVNNFGSCVTCRRDVVAFSRLFVP